MKHALLAAAIALPALTVSAGALAHIAIFNGTLTSAAEGDPTNTSVGTGTVKITLDDHDFTMRIETSFSGLTGTTTAAHIHCCTASANSGSAGVATTLPSFPDFPAGVTSGDYDRTFDMTEATSWNTAFVNANGGTLGTAFSALATALEQERAYLNIHTSYRGGGEIRGFLAPAPVPEPETYALFMTGLGLLAFGALKRRPAS